MSIKIANAALDAYLRAMKAVQAVEDDYASFIRQIAENPTPDDSFIEQSGAKFKSYMQELHVAQLAVAEAKASRRAALEKL